MGIHTAESRTFRATTEAWLGQLILPLGFFAMLTITAVRAAGLNPAIGWGGLALLGLIAIFDYLLPMARNWLVLDARTIGGSMNGRNFEIYWTEILAAWLYERNRRVFLCLGTRNGTAIIPLRFLNDCAIWDWVRTAVPPAALEENAIQRLPDYQNWQNTHETLLENTQPRTVTDHWLVQVAGWAGLTFFVLGAVEALQAGQILLAGLFVALVSLSLAILTSWGITEFNANGVQRNTLFGSWSMAWGTVRWIELDPLDSVMVLVSDDRQMVVPGPGVWCGRKKEAMALLLAQVEQNHIQMRRNPWAVFKVSRRIRGQK